MIRTVKTKFRASKATINQLFLLNELSAQVYNDCLRINNDYRKAHGGAWIGKKDLQKALKRQYPMHSQSIQAVLLSKSEAKMKDALHKTTRAFVTWALENHIKTVVVGEVEGVQRHTKGKKHKRVNQKLSNWSFGRVNQQLQYKLEAFSIEKEAQNEAYSTQTCPVCGRRKNRTAETMSAGAAIPVTGISMVRGIS